MNPGYSQTEVEGICSTKQAKRKMPSISSAIPPAAINKVRKISSAGVSGVGEQSGRIRGSCQGAVLVQEFANSDKPR